jgi:S-adenosylmethionine synthetase
MSAPLRLFTSESVTEGHPDKICDQISDSILDALLSEDPQSRVAVETVVTTGLVHVVGEVTSSGYADIPAIVRKCIVDIGYHSSEVGFDGASCGVSVSIGSQSPDIAQGVDTALEAREGETGDDYSRQGAGDQGIMFGFATTETPEFMPLPIWLAHRLAERLAHVRKSGMLGYLRPDGKTQVTIGYEGYVPRTVDTVVLSTQHSPKVSNPQLFSEVTELVIRPVLEGAGLDSSKARILINPTGRFEIGGPQGDAGLTGRKIIVDTYGGAARHGGGAFSGKDPSKVDRSAAYAMRWVAKNAVAAGLADRLEVQVAYAIGKAAPVGLYVESFGTAHVSDEAIIGAIRDVFDLRPGAIIDDLNLLRPIYAATATYGHFGRDLPDFTWERLDRVEALRSAVGL